MPTATKANVSLPIKPTPDLVLAIVDQLDEKDFSTVAEAVRDRARERACDAWDRMRSSARKAGLRKRDFEEAIKEVRARKRGRRAPATRRS